ncbi:CaiB/BaiF CoA transferase family protein [Geomicrobium sediminis]|uniref:Formyl-CoA transferase n=1 Tax=Geomicrobium sediminis TaxID=1347788 RepID=A0ABS2PDH9_9BACL|nr:CoA transferase [Geomicrobium sediminis]MBM7632863.1 formyl-CoA transferase [Geomicrobium sediminis]
MKSAMDGLIVLDLSQVYQGPYCGMLMAYQGAKVIKMEALTGEVIRQRIEDKNPHEFLMFNSNKLGISLNLKSSEGAEILKSLVQQADVLIENFTPGVMDRLGVGYNTLKEINPRLIYGSATGFGLNGPYSDFPGMDLTVQAISGVMASTGYEGKPPVKAGPAVCDILGGIHLYGGIATALYEREKSGVGQHVEVSMHDATYPALASPLAGYYEGEGKRPERTGNRHSGLRMAPYNVYQTKDGYVAIICVTEKHWEQLTRLMERTDLIGAPGYENTVNRALNMDVVDQIIEDWTKDKSKWDLMKQLKEARVPSSPVLSIAEVEDDEHLKARGMIQYVDHPIRGRSKVPGSPIRLSRTEQQKVTPAPLVGEHTEQVLQDMLHYSPGELERLREEGII